MRNRRTRAGGAILDSRGLKYPRQIDYRQITDEEEFQDLVGVGFPEGANYGISQPYDSEYSLIRHLGPPERINYELTDPDDRPFWSEKVGDPLAAEPFARTLSSLDALEAQIKVMLTVTEEEEPLEAEGLKSWQAATILASSIVTSFVLFYLWVV